MNIVVVGGGVSGLYCANLLESSGHNVTVVEDKIWGGCIQNEIIDGVPYPISVVVKMGSNKNYTSIFGNGDVISDYESAIKNYNLSALASATLTAFFLLTICISYMLKASVLGVIGVMVILIILLLALVRPTGRPIGDGNIVKRSLLTNIISPYTKIYGGVKTDDQFLNLTDDYDVLKMGQHSKIKNPKKIIELFMSNPNISYLSDNIESISYRYPGSVSFVTPRTAILVKFAGGMRSIACDKVVMACDYDSYSQILKLDEFSRRYLTDVVNFDFYSTLVKTDGTVDLNQSENILGYIRHDNNTYLFASHIPLDRKNFGFINEGVGFVKTYKWKMGFLRTDENRRVIDEEINGRNNIHFIGNSINVQNGVSSSMDFVESHLLKQGFIKCVRNFNFSTEKSLEDRR